MDDLEKKKRFESLFIGGEKPAPSEADKTTMANSPRNWLADKVNPVLDEYVNPVLPEAIKMNIPKMTVAEDKEFYDNLPENMGTSVAGSMKVIPSARFGKIINIGGREAAPGLGKVAVKDTAQDLAEASMKESMQGKQMESTGIMDTFRKQFVDSGEVAKAKASLEAQFGKGTEEFGKAYNDLLQNFYNTIRAQKGQF